MNQVRNAGGIGIAAVGVLLAGCSSLSMQAEARLLVFDTYVEALAENYPFFAQKHIDWQGLSATYRSAVVAADEPSQFYHLLTGLLGELDDPHVSLAIPDECWSGDAGSTTLLTDLPGLRIAAFDHRIHVLAWPKDAGPIAPQHLPGELQNYPEVTRVEGARTTLPLIGGLLRGPAGSMAELQLRWADGTLTRHQLRRPEASKRRTSTTRGNRVTVDVASGKESLADAASLGTHGRYALLALTTFNPERAGVEEEQFAAHIGTLLASAAERDGLILDLRDNGGGRLSLMAHALGPFLSRTIEIINDTRLVHYFAGLLTYQMFVSTVLNPRPPRITKPIVVLTSWRTGSAAEVFARLLQLEANATVIGEQTIGAEASLLRIPGGDGTTLTFGAMRNLDTRGVGFQGDGITPDISIRLTLDDVRREGSFDAAYRSWEQRALRAARQALDRLTKDDG